MKLLLLSALLLAFAQTVPAAAVLQNLTVEYSKTPLGLDVAQPRFAWQMAAAAGERGLAQAAFQLTVKNPRGNTVWDSGRVDSGTAAAIPYAGQPLQAATRYSWTVTAWDLKGAKLTASSWFETGLMDPSPNAPAWGGAKWIGGGAEDLALYAPYLSIFDVAYTVAIAPGSARASFVYGANDPRLMDRNKNIYQLQNAKDQSYIKLELDIAPLEATPAAKARLNVYRVGYQQADSPSRPFCTFEIGGDILTPANRNAEHTVHVRSAFGQITITIDAKASLTAIGVPAPNPGPGGGGPFGRTAPNGVNLNPAGAGGNYIAYGLLCDIGFALDPGQSATFRNVQVRNNRAPNNVLFQEDLAASPYQGIYAKAALPIRDGRFSLSGGGKGLFVVRDPSRNGNPLLRAAFNTAAKPIGSARLYVTARGIYEVYLNGKRISGDYYNPGLTQYNLTHLYQTYDVTPMLAPGQNALCAMLGEGWWSGLLSFGTIWNHFGDRQSLLAKLVVTYKDGTSDTLVTGDPRWKFSNKGPLVYASLDNGEVYDATREAAVAGWLTASYNDTGWKPAVEVPLAGTTFVGSEPNRFGPPAPPMNFDKLKLIGQIGENAGVYQTLTARSMKQPRPGVYVYDLGQNIVGVPRISIAAGKPGAKITLRFAEMPYPNLKQYGDNIGMILTENYRAALSQDLYTMTAGPQVYQPRFTSHGFQYIEITGLDQPLPLTAVQAVAISSIRFLTADYQSSHPKVNRLWSNLVWSNIDNFLTIPTDCPQRNERMGWSGDISVFSRTATYVSNADQFLTRHMQAMRDVQGANGRFTDVAPIGGGFGGVLWGSAGITVPWEVYLQYADKAILENHYPAMAAYIDFLDNSIDPKTGLTSDANLGDWLGPQNNALGPQFLATAYHVFDLEIMTQVATLLGKSEDAAKYRRLHAARQEFFNRTFVNADRKTLGLIGGRGSFIASNTPNPQATAAFKLADTQTSYAVGLALGAFSAENIPKMAKNLAETVIRENKDDTGVNRPPYSLMTGFIGTAWISKALSDSGRSDLAYRLLLNEQYPSWLYPINQGATSIWERLNSYTIEDGFGGNNSMNSFNHYSFGAVGQWLIAYSLGIQRGEPGFHSFILQPEPDPTGQMTSAEGHYDSLYGRIRSAWKTAGKTLTYTATVPANTTATLFLPAASPASVKESGKTVETSTGVKFLRHENGKAVYTLQSGTYSFVSQM